MARHRGNKFVMNAVFHQQARAGDAHLPGIAEYRLGLHRDDYFKPTEENAGLAQLIIAKQRNGPTGEVVLRFFREYMRFENYTRRAEPMQ
ncbi:MAG TPA: hypothetical protein ENI87_01865 [bacterium]|nr:hypothetical protein [bacterium]